MAWDIEGLVRARQATAPVYRCVDTESRGEIGLGFVPTKNDRLDVEISQARTGLGVGLKCRQFQCVIGDAWPY